MNKIIKMIFRQTTSSQPFENDAEEIEREALTHLATVLSLKPQRDQHYRFRVACRIGLSFTAGLMAQLINRNTSNHLFRAVRKFHVI